ncbi:hypothetical protein LSM04_000212 [Trypanosoma melophagium]|uniref:uncharacterized protein n=1 Tax=Trypanosoma melophagium TaxID=715481 RepID=UPI003519E08B|nr:hypothetical protein LSM04_000212 [Trypanosoma melophagium]
MLPVVHEYLTLCSQRRVEPYYGFIEHAGACEVVTDLDFAPAAAVRLFALALQRSSQRHIGLARGAQLKAFVLRYGVNKGGHHPPRQSRRTLSHEVLLPRRREEDIIVSPQNRAVLRSLLDGVRVACSANVRYLVRVELCGLPLRGMPETTGRLFEQLPHCDVLRVLKLSRSSLTDALFTRLTTVPCSFRALKEAQFSECELTDRSARGIHSLILLNRSREQTAVWRASLRDGGSAGVGGDGASSRALEALDLSGNRLGDVTLKRIALAIAHDVSLRVVDMSRNVVTTAGLTEFLQDGALQGSAIETFDLSKNLIDSHVAYAVVEGFTCLQTCEQQLLLTRIKGHRHDNTNTTAGGSTHVTTVTVSTATNAANSRNSEPNMAKVIPLKRGKLPLQSKKASSSSTLAVTGTGQPVAAPPEVSLTTPQVEEEKNSKSHITTPAAALEINSDHMEVSFFPIGHSENHPSPGRESASVHRSTVSVSPEALDRHSSRNDGQGSLDRPPIYNQPQQQKQQHQHHHNRHQQPSPLPPPLQHQQQQELQFQQLPGGMSFFPQLFSSSINGQQWCSVPLFVPIPLASLGVVPPPPPPPTTTTTTTTKEQEQEEQEQKEPSASPPPPPLKVAGEKQDTAVVDTSLAVSGEPGTDRVESPSISINCSSAFEKMMVEPLTTGEFEFSEWREKEEKFLESLVVRVESHETAVTEMVERNYQATREQLNSLKEELSTRIHEVLAEQRREQERLRGELREGLSAENQKLRDPEGAITEQLAQLIYTGMKRIHEQMDRPSAKGSTATAKVSLASGNNGSSRPVQDYLREVKDRLNGLGW